ncbi:hypothetical protein F892_03157 [Acinetobacter vivianii]|uniref:Uncharacterized protein n=1 Tax=Acinetobacter vivianii TaxID=1776742 RepID=N9NGM5_9GAMM|nr:hypothetical protein [Acinetobacter vivianii]ENX20234.1 hypothetical protein F892_03157 [Acinetobacter vivianii]GGI59318.1 hypothetical protein GCM10011446_08130 [Acinetobacter vivianii]
MDLKLKKIHKVIDSIIAQINYLLDKCSESNDQKINEINTLKNYSLSFLPAFKNEIGVKQKILNDEVIFKIIYEGLNSIDVNIQEIRLHDCEINEKIRDFVIQVKNTYNVRRDLRLIYTLDENFNNKFNELKNNFLLDSKKEIVLELGQLKENFDKTLQQSKQKYESELKELRLKLKTITENNDTTLKNLFDFYEDQLKAVKNSEYEDKRSRDKIFSDFIGKYREEKDFVIDETLKEKEKIISEIKVEKDGIVQSFEEYFHKIQTDWKRIQQIKTENVYLNAYHKNTARSKYSENKFIAVTALSLFLSVLTIIAFIFKAIDFSQFISIKIMIVVFFGILIAYYLKISTHYRRLADQAEQTHLELLAFPQYAAELGEEKSREIKEQLALKYFGKEIDVSGY